MERSLSRISVRRCGPRDLAAIRDGLNISDMILERLAKEKALPFISDLKKIMINLEANVEVKNQLSFALRKELPISVRDGGFISIGYSSELDKLIEFRDQNHQLIVKLQVKYAELTNIPKLKIKY